MYASGFQRELLTQRGQAGRGCVLIMAGLHRLCEGISQRCRWLEIGKTLAEINGVMLLRQTAHGGKDGRADGGQLGDNGHGSGVSRLAQMLAWLRPSGPL